ncbi:hypothetical protein ACIQ7Q_17455 [Streptomyces sp. NPDC096176]|uniref:hypothetical protein n=1 Tax=Streptomyces sp. NPDC096176 TaxID=3366079 RepID=UPI00382C46E9
MDSRQRQGHVPAAVHASHYRPSGQAPRRTGPLVAALVVGLLIGGGGGATWALVGGSSGSGEAADDARGACDALAGFEPSQFMKKGDKGLVALNRWNGAVVLSAAAAAGDPEHKPLATALRRAADVHAQPFEFDDRAMKEISTAHGICDDL